VLHAPCEAVAAAWCLGELKSDEMLSLLALHESDACVSEGQ